LKRLNELNLLGHVYATTGTSGGALMAALLQQYQDTISTDLNKRHLLYNYNWEAFERSFLSLAKRGVFAPTLLLVLAYLLYVAGLVFRGIAFVVSRWVHWKGLHAFSLTLSILILITGLVLHVVLASILITDNAHAASDATGNDPAKSPRSKRRILRLFLMLLSPSYLRWQTLNFRVFKGQLLSAMPKAPMTLLTAVEMNSGKEMVFSSGLYSNLSDGRKLWEQRTANKRNKSGTIEVAQAVAASTALPPWFRPVPIWNAEGLVGVFVDGGVLDNYSLNVPRSFSVSIHPRRGQRYDGSSTSLLSFRRMTSFILMMDGGKAPETTARSEWGRLRTIARLFPILVDQQFAAAQVAARDFDWNAGIPTRIVGLSPGFPPGTTLRDDVIARYVARIRTHLDSFSLEECAVVAYCGYTWIDVLAREREMIEHYEGARWAPLTDFPKILPDYCGIWQTSLDGLRRHLRYSNRRFRFFRSLGRRLGI
jgi:hypothetical protein